MKNFFKEFETIFDIFSEETFKVPNLSSITIHGNSFTINGKHINIMIETLEHSRYDWI